MSIESRARRRARENRRARRTLKVLHFLGQPSPGYAKMKREEDARLDAQEVARTARMAALARVDDTSPAQPWSDKKVVVVTLAGVIVLALLT